MNYYDLLLAKKMGGGGGSSVTVEPLSVTQNGTYTAPTGTAYDPVEVNVSDGIDYVIEEQTVEITGGDLPTIEVDDSNLEDQDYILMKVVGNLDWVSLIDANTYEPSVYGWEEC